MSSFVHLGLACSKSRGASIQESHEPKETFLPPRIFPSRAFSFRLGSGKSELCVFRQSAARLTQHTRGMTLAGRRLRCFGVAVSGVCMLEFVLCAPNWSNLFSTFFLTFQPIAPIGCLERLWVVIGPIPSWRKHVEFYFLFIYSGAIFFICSAVLTWACVVVGSLNSGRYLFILCLIWREIFTSLPDMFTKGVTIWSKRWKWLPAATPLPPSPNQHPQQERVCQQL